MTAFELYLLVLTLDAISFGGGQTLMAALERELVGSGLLSPAGFGAAVALGHATPGPISAVVTAIGAYTIGFWGAVAAALAMVTVSFVAVMFIGHIPRRWFELGAIKGGLAVVPIYVTAVLFLLAYRIGSAGDYSRLFGPTAIVVLVCFGQMSGLPSLVLMIGGVTAGMLLQGTSWAAW